MLKWRSHPHMVGTQVAVGAKGEYSVQQVGAKWILQGRGHDGLSMLPIPVQGDEFDTLDTAQERADKLDRVRTVEAQASGC